MRVLYLVPLFFICWLSMIVLALAVFRQRLKEYRKQIVVSAVVLTLISVFVQTTHSVIGLILQPLFVILCFYMIFRLRFIYALIVSVVVYLVDTTTELGFFLMISRLTSEDFYKIAQESMTMPVISLFLLNLSAACILKKFRLGFSFVPFHINCKDHIHPRFHKAMFFIMSTGLLIITLTVSSIFYWKAETAVIQFFSVLLLIGIIRIFYEKELSDD
ncbi:hypothetical protein PN4B1_08900 [Paenibacillus naphthalenovorans]|uniref:Uncharacterized protein n=3 Tax=Paenibacillus TaxID=44249 RepID=A0A0U2W6E3_9BACL|nr:hypothetical protein IJ22_05670 [Paenibacillus naphthalenovorans]GCL70986.1 hypothetical protein PN4B1_08900 [Paenibacillus naphthalenovorans]SDI59642.1 hypothetical protein SAMN05421868_10859 [Paenibacillus naphthalenovorans]